MNTICIKNREYIGDIVPTLAGGFQIPYTLPLNPGMASTFPWLSNIASYFDEYVITEISFEFNTMITSGNTGAGGSVVLGTRYNCTTPAFANKSEMENSEGTVSSRVDESLRASVICNGVTEYVRAGPIPSTQDLKTYDLATFYVATNGTSTSTVFNLGELWVSYTVYLRKAKVPPIGSFSRCSTLYASYTCGASSTGVNGTLFGGPGSVTVTNPSNGNFNSSPGGYTSNLGSFSWWYSGGTNNYIILPSTVVAGNYVMVLTWTGLTSGLVPAVAYSGSTGVSSYLITSDTTTSDTVYIATINFTVNNTGNTQVLPTAIGLTCNTNIAYATFSFLLTQIYSS